MATPKPQSYEQILGQLLATYLAKTGINDTNVNSAMTSFFETVALTTSRASGDIFQVLRDISVDRAEGDALRRILSDEGLRELAARVASGVVTISDSSFTKVQAKIYAGDKAPNIGSTVIKLSSNEGFTPTGAVYIGRGTPNVEGPINYTSIVPVGSFFEMTLSTATTKFHNINETVVLSQGGVRNIFAGTVVRSPSAGSANPINFTVTQNVSILDGETSVTNVQVSAQEPGTSGNVPIGGIREFGAIPFAGATVNNELPFKTGRDTETDEEIRIRIKRARLSRGLGTALAIRNSVIGATPADEPATVVSAEIVSSADQTILYLDDGTGYEAKTQGVGVETLVDSALGGEINFQLTTGGRQTSVAKAFLISNLSGPFDIRGTDSLAIVVGGITTEHVFSSNDFISEGGATAYEIVASINANSDLNFEATTSNGGTKVVISAKAEVNENIKITTPSIGRDAAVLMGFPSNEIQTLRLFKNKTPLSKDGSAAFLLTDRQVQWSPTIANGETLIIAVDGTAAIAYTFNDADFIAEGTHTTVSATNTLESWVSVLNNKLTGITASIVGEQIQIVSNLGASSRASILIDPASTLVIKGMFSADLGLAAQGAQSDYSLSRNTAQIKLRNPLAVGDELTVGTSNTEAQVRSERILGGVVTLSSAANVWILADTPDAEIINTGLTSNTLIGVSKPSVNILRYTSSAPNAFVNLQVGDYVIVWSEQLSVTNRLEGRINAVTSSYFDIRVTPNEYVSAIVESGINFQEGIVVLRSDFLPQKYQITAGTKSLNQIADELNTQTFALNFDVIDDEILTISTATKSSLGSVLVVTFDDSGKTLSLQPGAFDTSKDSLIAFYESAYKEASFPLFFHSRFAGGSAANPPNSFLSSLVSVDNLTVAGFDPNVVISYLQPYSSILDADSVNENTITDNVSGTVITVDTDRLVRRVKQNDRFFIASPLDLSAEDELVVVLDEDATNKTYQIPLFRKALTNTTLANNSTSFNAYDSDGGPTNPFTNFFGSAFSFDNYKVLMKAKNVLDNASVTQDAVLFRAFQYGRSGEKINVGYTYPTAANNPISHTAQVSDVVDIRISLKSGAPVTTAIDGTTEWNVSITPNTPTAGTDQVTYTWNGTGTSPALGVLSGGEYVNINQESELSSQNTGIYRVSDLVGFAPTATSFTVQKKNGTAIAESDKATLVADAFSFYAADPTTAQEVVDYVTANLSNFITATIVDDSGLAGTGIISRSTAESLDFFADSLFLKDGLNWIASTNLSGSPQFTFKVPLTLPSASGYAFNQSEEIVFLPTTVEQVYKLSQILAVTGLTTVGSIGLTQREQQIEIATQVLGGNGAIQIVGGFANSSQTPVIGTSSVIDNQYIKSNSSSAGLLGFHSDQFVKLQASNKQAKETLFKAATSISIAADSPTLGKSLVTLFNKSESDRFFGKPRHHIRTDGRSFKVEKQGNLVCLSWTQAGSSPAFAKVVNLDDSAGGSLQVEKVSGTNDARYIIVDGIANFSEVSINDLITVTGMDNTENNGTFLVTGISDDGKTLRVLNPNAIDEFPQGLISVDSIASLAGDEVVVGGNILVAGVDFAVGVDTNTTAANLASAISALPGVSAVANASLITVTADTVNTFTTLVYNNMSGGSDISLSGPALAGRQFSAGDFSCTTQVEEGDTVIMTSPFNVLNQGSFRVIRRFNDSIYFENSRAVEETVALTDTNINFGADITTTFDITATNNRLLLSYNSGTIPDFSSAKAGDILTLGPTFSLINQGSFMVTRSTATTIEAMHAAASNEFGVAYSAATTLARPSMIFFEYEATVPGDSLTITSDLLGSSNIGQWTVESVLADDQLVVSATMATTPITNLAFNETVVFIEEGIAYSGYKKIHLISVDPANSLRGNFVFDTRAQSSKINEDGDVSISALNKLGFNTILRKGLDSYRYHTGMIGEANRIVYGDPRDTTTYPGVAAAGAEIFIREPLTRRVQVSVDVRVETGVPFAQIVEQVRTNVAALINSNDIGQSIAISDIVSTINSIPGVRAVAISSPLYNASNDTIKIQPSEKARVLNIIEDIGVSRIE